MSGALKHRTLVIVIPAFLALVNLAVALHTDWWFSWLFVGAFVTQFVYELAEPRP